MDIYTRKSNLKLVLIALGLVIGVATVLYTNQIANRLARDEKYKAKLWAEAIGRKARLVRYTKELFTKLAEDERHKVAVYAQSTKFILTVEDNDLLTFFNDIITSNSDIPAILTDNDGNIVGARNIDLPAGQLTFNALPDSIKQEFSVYAPIEVNSRYSRNFIYYKDSNLFTKLKQTLNDLVGTFISEVVVNTASAPVILTDEKMNILDYGNIDSAKIKDEDAALKMIKEMQADHEPIVADLGSGVKRYIYYDDSLTLKRLRVFPFVQLGIFAVFLLISYLAFSNTRRAEQNLVWVGMAKETAHQLGTPISSLEGWVEYLRDTEALKGNENILNELQSDVNRLSLVADRFSKIGSVPQLMPHNVFATLERNVNYMRRRASAQVNMELVSDRKLQFNINPQLFDWVLENLLKNALDAMEGAGKIRVEAGTESGQVFIDVTDTGKGIAKNKFETVFEPGFSTKRRGWGLGLSLTRRIVQDYHKGKIFVKSSELGKGTTFRILLPTV
ncbi:MAG: HAMP domain-containing sensor histidine kinase [Chitinophagales bacterium]